MQLAGVDSKLDALVLDLGEGLAKLGVLNHDGQELGAALARVGHAVPCPGHRGRGPTSTDSASPSRFRARASVARQLALWRARLDGLGRPHDRDPAPCRDAACHVSLRLLGARAVRVVPFRTASPDFGLSVAETHTGAFLPSLMMSVVRVPSGGSLAST